MFQNHKGEVLGCFAIPICIQYAFFSEVFTIILGIEIASWKQWRKLWIETDSTSIVAILSSDKAMSP